MSTAVGYVGAPLTLEALVFHPEAGLAEPTGVESRVGRRDRARGVVARCTAGPRGGRFASSRHAARRTKRISGASRARCASVRGSPAVEVPHRPTATSACRSRQSRWRASRLRAAALLPRRAHPSRRARTGGWRGSSEWLHALVASALAEGAPLDEAVSWALGEIAHVRRYHGLRRASVANLVVSDGECLAAVRFTFDAGQDDPAQPGAWDERGLHYAFARTRDGVWHVGGGATQADGLVVTSAPPPGAPGWFEVPEYTMLIADFTGGRLGLRWHPLEL